MKKALNVSINRREVILWLLPVVVMVCRYRIEQGQGYIVFPIEIVLCAILLLWNLATRSRFEKGPVHHTILLTYIFFIVYRIIVSFLLTGNSFAGMKRIIYYELGTIVILVLSSRELEYKSIILRLRDFGAINSVIGCFEFFTRVSLFLPFISNNSALYHIGALGTSGARVRSIFLHPIICAVFIMIEYILLLYVPYKNVYLNTVLKIITIVALIGTQSRSSWISLLLVLLVYHLINIRLKREIHKSRLKRFVGMSIVIIAFAFAMQEPLGKMMGFALNRWLTGMNVNDAGNYNRVTMIRMGLRDFVEADLFNKIFGHGYLHALSLLRANPIRGWNKAVDNTYLTILLDYGLIGLLFVVSLIIKAFKALLNTNKTVQLYGMGIISLFAAGFFFDMFVWFTIDFLLCIFICGLYYEQKENNPFERV